MFYKYEHFDTLYCITAITTGLFEKVCSGLDQFKPVNKSMLAQNLMLQNGPLSTS